MASTAVKYFLAMPVIRSVVPMFQKAYAGYIERECKKFGLYYDDWMSEAEEVTKRVIEILPEEEKIMRHKRIRRAIDLNLKKTYLHPDLQKEIDVWHPYIRSRIPLVQKQMQQERGYNTD